MSFVLAGVVVSSLIGCTAPPRTIQAARTKLHRAETTAEVQTLLGAPESVVLLEGAACGERWSYAGGCKNGKLEVVFIDFDRSGQVCEVTYGHVPREL